MFLPWKNTVRTVKPFNPEVVDKVLGDEKKNAITCRPADLLEPELDKIEAEIETVETAGLKMYYLTHCSHRLQLSSSNTVKHSRKK